MSKTRTRARSSLVNRVGPVAGLMVVFSLSQFMAHGPGRTACGVWWLIVAVAGYLGLAEMRVRVSTDRPVEYHVRRSDQQDAPLSPDPGTALAVATGWGIYGAVMGMLIPVVCMN